MKMLILAIAAASSLLTVSLFTAPASARSMDPTPVVATLTALKVPLEGIKTVALLADGRLQVVKEDGALNTVEVSEHVLNYMIRQTRNLGDAQLTETSSLITCRMMPLPQLSDLEVGQYDESAGKFTAPRLLVLTGENCHDIQTVRPTNAAALKVAYELRAQLTALALNALK